MKFISKTFLKKLILFLILFLFIVIFLFYYKKSKIKEEKIFTPPPKVESKIIRMEDDQLPPYISKDLVIEKDIKVLNNYYTKPFPYDQEMTMYQIQSVFTFESLKTVNESFELYKKYLKEKGWQISTSTEKENYKKITTIPGNTGPDLLTITIQKGSSGKNSIVNLLNIHIGPYREINRATSSLFQK